jgi:hypothetical protein
LSCILTGQARMQSAPHPGKTPLVCGSAVGGSVAMHHEEFSSSATVDAIPSRMPVVVWQIVPIAWSAELRVHTL